MPRARSRSSSSTAFARTPIDKAWRFSRPPPASTRGNAEPAFEVSAEIASGRRRERLEGALQNSLAPDVDPGAGGHLAVHRQAERLEAPELLPGGPGGHEQGVGDQHPRSVGVRLEDPDGLARLNEESLVVAEPQQRFDDAVVRGPVPRRLARAAVDDELGRLLRHLRIEIVLEHPQGGLLLPSAAAKDWSPRGADRAGGRLGGHALIVADGVVSYQLSVLS